MSFRAPLSFKSRSIDETPGDPWAVIELSANHVHSTISHSAELLVGCLETDLVVLL